MLRVAMSESICVSWVWAWPHCASNSGLPGVEPICRRERIAADERLPIDVDTATFFIGHSTIVAGHAGQWAFIPEAVFAYLKRNAVREEHRYGLPTEQVMEIGEQIVI